MAAVSFSIQRGNDGFSVSAFTVGTNAPAANDFEFRISSTDANGHALTRKDAIVALKAFERAILSGAIFSTAPPL
jgi:hypothetical protein